jgi:flavin-dependent dehydrogenase
MEKTADYDVIIIGAGLAGLTLSRQLLLETDKRILLIDRRDEIPPKKQKVGESLVQVGGYYFGKVLDLEEHLFCEHLMKYNLRFYWRSAKRENRNFEDFGQAYIRSFSNIPCYQLDRNKIEGELLRCNQRDKKFEFIASISGLGVTLADDDLHTVAFVSKGSSVCATAHWVVDTSGRMKVLAHQMDLVEENDVHHGAAFFWVDGLIDIEKLTDRSLKDRRLDKNRMATGHLPLWLATNHFMGEGFWFWVIPLQGKTSLGLVYDNQLISHSDVGTPGKLIDWVCERFPLFERDLRNRKVIDHSSFKSFSYGCKQTINKSRWAMSGEAGRFADPLYSPGSDFIAFHNTLIVDAIQTDSAHELESKCNFYELTVRSIYESLLPTYAISYDALGDQEAFSIKYTWELSVYFSFFVFPFINDLCTDRRFVLSFFKHFSVLGPINKNLQRFISAYYQWKKKNDRTMDEPIFHDFTQVNPLQTAADTFYKVGLSVEEARLVLAEQVVNLTELARYFVAYMCSVILDDKAILTNRSFVDAIDLEHLEFDLQTLQTRYLSSIRDTTHYDWSFDSNALEFFRTASGNLTENISSC